MAVDARTAGSHYSEAVRDTTEAIQSARQKTPIPIPNRTLRSPRISARIPKGRAVRPKPAHAFLIRLLERSECDYAHLLPWIRKSVVRL